MHSSHWDHHNQSLMPPPSISITMEQKLIIMSDEVVRSVTIKGEMIADPLPSTQESETKEQASWSLFTLFCYLYFVQGVIIGLIGTMPYVYPSLPGIDTMALFNSITLPYSFKFLIAPFLEKFSSVEYGKRKTWIIISQLSAAVILFIASFFTDQGRAKTFAILCFAIQIWMVVQNIALHSLIVKEIPDPHQSSLIQSFAEVLGILFGGLLLLKLTSRQFAHTIGLSEPITSPQVILVAVVIIICFPVAMIHFIFRQRTLESQKRGSKFTFCQIIQNYKVFLNPDTQYFRFCMVVLAYNQGLNFFSCLYDYKLVQAGFSRDTSNTIGNIVIIPIIALTFCFGGWTSSLGGNRNAIMFCTGVTVAICLYLLLVFPTDVFSISVATFSLGLLDSWRFYSFGVLINSFPLHALSGMFITVLGSYFNFGRLTFLHTYLSGRCDWITLSLLGLALQVVIVAGTPKMFAWMQEGDLTLPKEIEEQQETEKGYQEMDDMN